MEVGGRETAEPHEAWIAADQFHGDVRVLITGPQCFERIVTFAVDEEPAVISSGSGRRWKTDLQVSLH